MKLSEFFSELKQETSHLSQKDVMEMELEIYSVSDKSEYDLISVYQSSGKIIIDIGR